MGEARGGGISTCRSWTRARNSSKHSAMSLTQKKNAKSSASFSSGFLSEKQKTPSCSPPLKEGGERVGVEKSGGSCRARFIPTRLLPASASAERLRSSNPTTMSAACRKNWDLSLSNLFASFTKMKFDKLK